MAMDNASQGFRARQDAGHQYETMSEDLRERLHLRNAPNASSASTSRIFREHGRRLDGQFRRRRARQEPLPPLSHQDRRRGGRTFARCYEVIKRRFERARKDGDYPDLLVVDGEKATRRGG